MFKHKLVRILQTANEKDLVERSLLHLEGVVDEQLIIPGMIRSRFDASYDGLPTDGTYEIVRKLAQEHPQMRLVEQGFYDSWETIKHAFLKYMEPGTWYLVLDADEFYNPQDLLKARALIDTLPANANELIPTYIHFQWNMQWILNPPKHCNITHQRFLKHQEGDSYLYCHPTIVDRNGIDTAMDQRYHDRRFVVPDLHVYHLGHCKPRYELVKKSIWDRRVLGKLNEVDVIKYGTYDATEVFYDRLPDVVLKYDGYIPFDYGYQPDMSRIEPFLADIKHWRDHEWYKKGAEVPQISNYPPETWMYNTKRLADVVNI